MDGTLYIPELTITSTYVHSKAHCNTFTMGNPVPQSTITLCQSRLYPPVRDFGFSLRLCYTVTYIYTFLPTKQQSHTFKFFFLLCTVLNTASSAAPQIPLCWNPGLLRLRHWQSDALITRLDLISLDLYPSVVHSFYDFSCDRRNIVSLFCLLYCSH
jgi:hypothetical protein